MNDSNYPVPQSHKTFEFGQITIDSNFDSGNLYSVQKINGNNFNLWISVDHPKNQYRTWFHFSLKGVHKGTLVTFNIKNMQNQSRLLNEGLVPVFREQNSSDWKRIAHKIDLSKIEYNEGWIEWNFKHTMTSDEKVFFAFFYPWSNTDNALFLDQIQEKCKKQEDLYFKRSNIIKSLQGRPVQFLTISSKKQMMAKNQKYQDEYLFSNGSEPKGFDPQKKCIVIGARVHPGEVPSSHVMTGIISELTQDSDKARLLRDKFVFYLFPIINPDGVARGHYRVDPNGINLNRCYINPSPKNHSPIYAIKKIILHLHNKNKYFGFLDLHAHAARKGVFIYGNSANQLQKQVEICLFPKILSMNSEIFEYQGSNFTEKNMYCKDINDHVSKEGAGRVALFKATKNPYSWTLQCNYNTSRVINVIDEPKKLDQQLFRPNQKQLEPELIINYKYPTFKQPKQFYTIQHFRRLGKQICESFLDLVELNPQSRIDNPRSYFKSVQNLKMNLAVALLRMAPNRFELPYKKIYHCIESPSTTKELSQRGVRALYYLLIKKAKIQNMPAFLKDNDDSSVVLPVSKILQKKVSLSPSRQINSPTRNARLARSNGNEMKMRIKPVQNQFTKGNIQGSRESIKVGEEYSLSSIKLTKIQNDYKLVDSEESQGQEPMTPMQMIPNLISFSQQQAARLQALKLSSVLNSQLLQVNFNNSYQRILGRQNQVGIDSLRAYRKSFNSQTRRQNSKPVPNIEQKNIIVSKPTPRQLPTLVTSKIKAIVSIGSLANQIKLIKKGNSMKDPTIFYFPSD